MQYFWLKCAFASAMALTVPAFTFASDQVMGGSVEELLEFARQRNPEFATMRHESQAAIEQRASAGALPDPKLRIELEDVTRMGDRSPTLAPNRVGRTRYQFMQELPFFGKRDLEREIAALEAENAKGRAEATWSDIAARIKSEYARLYYLDRNEQLTSEIADLLARLTKVTQARYASGLAAQPDAIRAQVEQTNLRRELIELTNEKRIAQARLNLLLGRPAFAPLAAPQTLRTLPEPQKLDYALLEGQVRNRNPRVLADDARVRSAEKSRDLAWKNRYPDFAVGLAPVQEGNSVREWEVMFEVNIPLQQSSRRAKEREADANLAAARSRKDASATQAVAELAENLSALEAARQSEQITAQSLLPQAELTYKAALASYENGKVDFATLLDAQRQIRMAKQNLIKAQAEAQARLADIERLVGEDL